MSELRAYKADVTIPVYGTIADAEVYLKPEADKVISKLKESVKKLILDNYLKDKAIAKLIEIDSENRSAYYKDLAMMVKDVEYHKYKRCLAMARWCDDRYEDAFERVLSVRDMGFEPSDELTFHLAFFKKWHKRWLELAERFKEDV